METFKLFKTDEDWGWQLFETAELTRLIFYSWNRPAITQCKRWMIYKQISNAFFESPNPISLFAFRGFPFKYYIFEIRLHFWGPRKNTLFFNATLQIRVKNFLLKKPAGGEANLFFRLVRRLGKKVSRDINRCCMLPPLVQKCQSLVVIIWTKWD